MQPTLTHVALLCRDIDKSVDFYSRYARLVEVHRRVDDDVTVVWIGEKGRETEFVLVLLGFDHADAVEPAPLAHLGYAVDSRSEVDRLANMADQEGIVKDPPTDGGPVVGYYCIVTDPDGNQVEFSYGQSLGPGR